MKAKKKGKVLGCKEITLYDKNLAFTDMCNSCMLLGAKSECGGYPVWSLLDHLHAIIDDFYNDIDLCKYHKIEDQRIRILIDYV